MSDASDFHPIALRYALLAKIADTLKDHPTISQWNGHFKGGEYFRPEAFAYYIRDTFLFARMDLEEAQKLDAALDALVACPDTSDPFQIPPIERFFCPFCGERLKLGFTGEGLVVLNDACTRPEGLVTETELNVPSGKLVIANDLRHWFPCDVHADINTILGCHEETVAHADIGLAFGFVGNTCPGVYRDSEGKLVVGNYPDEIWADGDDEEEGGYYDNPDPCPWGESVSSICTDLWWYCMCDLDELGRRIAHYAPDQTLEHVLKDYGCDVVDVEPGVYLFRHDQAVDRDEDEVLFATITRVRDPDPVRDFLGEDHAKDIKASEYLIESCLSWPTLYMGASSLDRPTKTEAVALWKQATAEERVKFLARAADHLMVTIGNGVEWHEKGFPRGVLCEEAKEFARLLAEETGLPYGEVPSFDFGAAVEWYPISRDFSAMCRAAGLVGPARHMDPSYVRLALNICQNVIRYGIEPRHSNEVYPPAFEIPYSKRIMRDFWDTYQGLRQHCPDIVEDIVFDAWMQEKTSRDVYIESFNWGPAHPPEEDWPPPPVTRKKGKYFVFDSMLLEDGNFCWNPHKSRSGWAHKENAERYCLRVATEDRTLMGGLMMGASSCAGAPIDATVPLKVVGRVIGGTGDGFVSKHLLIEFDYGTEDMRTRQWALSTKEMPAVVQFDDEDMYHTLLEECRTLYEAE